jgi:thiamine pyrophosphate-dependent acetolactate synthase large subunit-like protein
MADGYARISGRVGVVSAQNGPVATLLVSLGGGAGASIPIVTLVQESGRTTADKDAFRELDHLDVFAPAGCRQRLLITALVLNNGILGYQKHVEDVIFGEHTDAVDFSVVGHAAIARACRVEGRKSNAVKMLGLHWTPLLRQMVRC